jgi:choline-glycine betaine transporter
MIVYHLKMLSYVCFQQQQQHGYIRPLRPFVSALLLLLANLAACFNRRTQNNARNIRHRLFNHLYWCFLSQAVKLLQLMLQLAFVCLGNALQNAQNPPKVYTATHIKVG